MTEDRRPCPFTLPNGLASSEWHPAETLHSHAGSLSYVLSDPSADPRDREPSELLQAAKLICDKADEVMRAIVFQCRDEGMTWEQIGAQLGVTRQAVHERFGRRGDVTRG